MTRGLVGLAVGTALALGVSTEIGSLALALSSVVLISAWVSPNGAYATLERWLDRLVDLVGRVVSLLVMVPIFYVVFLPFGLLFRRGQRDGMKRMYEPGATTYWRTRDTPIAPEDRERLF